jgi:hypothetical protein
MQNAADDGVPTLPKHRNNGVSSVVSELTSLLDHVQTSIKAIEAVIAHEASSESSEYVDSAVVLDDVTPRYARASAALSACSTNLNAALNFLREAEASTTPAKSMPKLIRLTARM